MSPRPETAADHRERVLAAMRAASIDVLMLGREANARYVSGTDRLWLAGTRPFMPSCVLVGATGATHVLSITDDEIPADLPADALYPLSWNPMALLTRIAAFDGVGSASRIGIDGWTPMFEQLIGAAVPGAELVDGESLLRTVRRRKSAADVAAIAAAVDAAEMALAAVADALRPGCTELDLQGAYEEAMTGAGLTAPAFEGTCCVVDPGEAPRTFASDRLVIAGDRVHVRAGVMRDGWEGLVARTLVCDGEPVRSATAPVRSATAPVRSATAPVRSPVLADAVARCAPGTRVADVRRTPAVLDGTGMGHEELFDDDVLGVDMVVAVEVLVDDVLDGAVVHVTDAGPIPLGFSAR